MLAAPFSQIADRLEGRVVVADLASGKLTTIGRAGVGPEEFRRPGKLVPTDEDGVERVERYRV